MRKMVWVTAAGIGVFLTAAVWLLLSAQPTAESKVEFARALLNLCTAASITGVLSFVFASRMAERARGDEKERVLLTAMSELKAGYEHVQVARFFLGAHLTAHMFGEQIQGLLEARLKLHRVQRERFVRGADGDGTVNRAVQEMLDDLRQVTNEYRDNYRRITEAALLEVRERDLLLQGTSTVLEEAPTLAPADFPHLTAFVDPDRWERSLFHDAYCRAKNHLQAQLDDIRRP